MINKTEWDKTNIGENYPGITLPLTYSFIRDAYSKVYPSFLEILGYKQSVLEDNSYLFGNMLGYINGEVFYNINNWYEFIKILPGYKYNKGFFENMLNPVKNKVDESNNTGGLNLIKLAANILFITKHYRIFDEKYDLFYSQFEKMDLTELSNKNLTQKLSYLERNFLGLWGHTIVNDFRVMVFFGIYTKLLHKILNNDEQLVSKHLRGITKKPESVNVLQELINIAKEAKRFNVTFSTYDNLKKEYPEIYKMIEVYLSKYGERSFNELKLEQTNFIDQPEQLLKLISYYMDLSGEALSKCEPVEINLSEKLPTMSYPLRILYKVLRTTSVSSIHKREEFRIKRAKVFRIANEFFKEMGTRMLNENLIEQPEDIYYLYKQEIIDTLDNHRLKENMTIIINQRKETLKEYKEETLPRRVVTKNIFKLEESEISETTSSKKKIFGKVTSSGDIKNGEIAIMPDLNFETDIAGKVLVTRATDPGWTILFPMLKGLIIETGGLLSHASIVAREMGIPCVVVPNALKIFGDKDFINLDGNTGQIEIINNENTA